MCDDQKRQKKSSIVYPLYLIFSRMNRYLKNGKKYLTLVPTNKSKKKKYEKLWIRIRDLIRSISKNLDDYDKCINVKFDLDDKFPR